MRFRRRTLSRTERLGRRVHGAVVRVLAVTWIARRLWRHGRPRRLARR